MSSLITSGALTLVVVILILLPYNKVDGDEHEESCSRKCGVHNISYPFRLKDSPKKCGDKRYTLSCEDNNQLILYYKLRRYYKTIGKYYVQSINYNNFTVRLLDSQLPPYYYSLGLYNITSNIGFVGVPDTEYGYNRSLLVNVLYLRCPNRVHYSSGISFDEHAACMNTKSITQGNSFYVNIGHDYKNLSELELGDGCGIELMFLTSWPVVEDDGGNNSNKMSCTDIRRMMFYGFELSWLNTHCEDGMYPELGYYDLCTSGLGAGHSNLNVAWLFVKDILIYYIGPLIFMFSVLKFVVGAPCIIALIIYKWRRKHLSMYDGIEVFLSSDNSIIPIRYSYKDIRKITKQFKTKLGSGGYGSVFKGQLRSGRLVAVKLLDNVKSNGQDFVNEVATIGQIHHVNIVQLIGFCVEGSKRALIYEFMLNGSLEKYIFSHNEESNSLNCEKLHAISLGVARGIEYLHNGCNMKILHFDIKPHNILLDENFNPKVSDFGLARLCPTDKSIVSLTAARGTIGYMAPELFYRNVGTITYKADVYSFGMLLMEMANRRKNLNALAEQSSQIYIPFWVYDQLKDGREITIENDTYQEMKLAKKMMIVALWCIQTKPSDRPSMNKVIEMLEEEDSNLQMPNKPYLYAQDLPAEDVRDDSIDSS
ncbi:rust resistance kinase Lr10-like [Trifolium pratense]|uniref:rust resistance kinase Lr10-like n=1 Tax=Trifolium pratense TaxID=57577 RepID=UPI001E6977FF|nr:rust resistance kinase Lr10-like [Trifolium pratense]